ncbi:MAG: sodium-dependent bicarbonate transport family permease [Planctomycetales bacterium]
MLHTLWEAFTHNFCKPLLMFFFMGFTVPLLGIAFEFPYVVYQGLTIYLLIAIGWHGGEELAHLTPVQLGQAAMFMGVGFVTNLIIGMLAFWILRTFTSLRRVDAATVSAYYGSDSAGTFVTCLGVLKAASIPFAPYMPVMLAVMEIPGCLLGMYVVSQLRKRGMDAEGNMPDEPNYNPKSKPVLRMDAPENPQHLHRDKSKELQMRLALQHTDGLENREQRVHREHGAFNAELLKEVFLNPGLFLLFGGIVVGYLSSFQGHGATEQEDFFFGKIFRGILCMFLLEMGITAAKRLKDLKSVGKTFILFGLVAPNIFATIGMYSAFFYSKATGIPLEQGTYVLFAVLCGSASYIAVPAIQRLAIPEASPALPLAASLGLTFPYNVTIGIPLYIAIAKWISSTPVLG